MKVLAEIQTARQRVTLAEQDGQVGMLINDSIQFHGGDQGPLHELLVSLPLCLHRCPRRVLVLGGGIGLAAREALRYPEVERLVLVEIDPELVELTRTHPVMRALHCDAFSDPRVELVIADAFVWVATCRERFDLVVNAVDVSFTPQDQEMTEQTIRHFWTAERELLREAGWLTDYLNDVEIGEYFDGDLGKAVRDFPAALGEGMAQALWAAYRGAHAGQHLFAYASHDPDLAQVRRPVPSGCEYLDDQLVRSFLKRGYLPGQRPLSIKNHVALEAAGQQRKHQ